MRILFGMVSNKELHLHDWFLHRIQQQANAKNQEGLELNGAHRPLLS
jgi:hypothetical protein